MGLLCLQCGLSGEEGTAADRLHTAGARPVHRDSERAKKSDPQRPRLVRIRCMSLRPQCSSCSLGTRTHIHKQLDFMQSFIPERIPKCPRSALSGSLVMGRQIGGGRCTAQLWSCPATCCPERAACLECQVTRSCYKQSHYFSFHPHKRNPNMHQ